MRLLQNIFLASTQALKCLRRTQSQQRKQSTFIHPDTDYKIFYRITNTRCCSLEGYLNPMLPHIHLHKPHSLNIGHTHTDPHSWPALNINGHPGRWFWSLSGFIPTRLGPAINTGLSKCVLPHREGRGGTVDTIHLFVYLEGAEGRLELVALVSMKSEVLMGQKWGEGLKGLFVQMMGRASLCLVCCGSATVQWQLYPFSIST